MVNKKCYFSSSHWVDEILQQSNLLWDPAKIKSENCVPQELATPRGLARSPSLCSALDHTMEIFAPLPPLSETPNEKPEIRQLASPFPLASFTLHLILAWRDSSMYSITLGCRLFHTSIHPYQAIFRRSALRKCPVPREAFRAPSPSGRLFLPHELSRRGGGGDVSKGQMSAHPCLCSKAALCYFEM